MCAPRAQTQSYSILQIPYLDELQDGAIINAETCVTLLYRSLWTFTIGLCGAVCSMGAGMLIAWKSSTSMSIRLVGMSLAVLRTFVVLWRWQGDLLMSNHHRGALVRPKIFSNAAMISCKDYRRSCELNAFPNAEPPPSLLVQTPAMEVQAALYMASQQTARFFQSWWLDWCADHFEVRYPNEGPTVTVDVRFWSKSHKVTVPEYVADGLREGTRRNRVLEWSGMIITVAYAGLLITQFALFALNDMSGVSASLYAMATLAGITATAYLRGFPLVCSGI